MLVSNISAVNSVDKTISRYIESMHVEINPTLNYKSLTITILTAFSRYHKDKPFTRMKREDIIAYLNSVRKTDEQDPMHKWIGTYNLYLTVLIRFFKWLYSPGVNPKNRARPKVVDNIPQLKRKETSVTNQQIFGRRKMICYFLNSVLVKEIGVITLFPEIYRRARMKF